MTDITMCLATNCPLTGLCRRKTTRPDIHLQSYASFKFQLIKGGVQCAHYLPENFEDRGPNGHENLHHHRP